MGLLDNGTTTTALKPGDPGYRAPVTNAQGVATNQFDANNPDYASELSSWKQGEAAKDLVLQRYQGAAQGLHDQVGQLQGRVGQIGQDYTNQLNTGLAQQRRVALSRIQGGLGALGAGQGGGVAMGQAAKEFGQQSSDLTSQIAGQRNAALSQAQQAVIAAQQQAQQADIAAAEQGVKRGTEAQDIQASQDRAESMVKSAIKDATNWLGMLDRSDAANELRSKAAKETDPYTKQYLEAQAHAIVTHNRS